MCSHWLKHHARTAEACGQLFAVLTQTLLHVYKKKHRCKSMISCNEPRLYIAKAKSSPSVYCSNVSVQQFLCSWLMQQCIPMERTPLKVASLCGKISTPIQYVVPWVHLTQHPNSISISTSVFAQLTVESPIYTLQWIVISPQKLALSVKHLHPLLIHGSLGQPHGTSIGSVVFARLTHVTNRQTDQQTDLATAYVATGLYR